MRIVKILFFVVFVINTALAYKFTKPRVMHRLDKIMQGKPGSWTKADLGYFQKVKAISSYELNYEKSTSDKLMLENVAMGGFWFPAALGTIGLEESYKAFHVQEDYSSLDKYYRRFSAAFGQGFDDKNFIPDYALNGYSLIYFQQLTGNHNYSTTADKLCQLLLKMPRVDGVIPYRKDQKYLLVDTLPMVAPFLARYGSVYGSSEATQLAEAQLAHYVQFGTDPATGLPFHGYIPGKGVRIGQIGWGRGTGWFLLGIADSIEYIPESPDRTRIVDGFRKAASTLRDCQLDSGLFTWSLQNPYAHEDTSGTALIAYSILKGIQLGILDKSYQPLLDKAVVALARNTTPKGYVLGAQGDVSGVGLYSQEFNHTQLVQGITTALIASTLKPRQKP